MRITGVASSKIFAYFIEDVKIQVLTMEKTAGTKSGTKYPKSVNSCTPPLNTTKSVSVKLSVHQCWDFLIYANSIFQN